MNIPFRLLAFAAVVSLVSGCAVSIGGQGAKHERTVVTREIVVAPAGTEDSAAFAEIDAVSQLSMDPAKVTALKNIAGRPNLSAPVQVRLVSAALKSLSFEPGKVDVLLALIRNSAFATAAKEAIFKQLNQLSFESNKTAVLDAIQQRSAGR
jgi:hypothetical protein